MYNVILDCKVVNSKTDYAYNWTTDALSQIFGLDAATITGL